MSKKKPRTIMTIPNYTYEPTADPNLQRFCDINGDWEYYYLVKEQIYLPAVNRILSLGYPKDKRFHEYLLNTTKEDAKKKLEQKGEEGSRTHEAITMINEGKRVSMQTKMRNKESGRMEYLTHDEMENLRAYQTFCDKYKPRRITYEFSMGDVEVGMAGTLDWLGSITIPDDDKKLPKYLWGKTIAVLLDWKTSAGIYDEYRLQVSIYNEMARRHEKLGKFYKANDVYTGIVRLGTKHADGLEIEIYSPGETQQHYQLALHAKAIHDSKAVKQFSPKIVEMVAEFSVKMPLLAITKNVNDAKSKRPEPETLPTFEIEPVKPKRRRADNGRPVKPRKG